MQPFLNTRAGGMTGMIAISGLMAGVLLAAVLLTGCSPSEEETDYLARKTLLLRQNQGIRELIAEAGQGSLVPTDRFLIGLDEKIVGDLFRSQLPLERPIGERLVIRLEKAEVSLRDKYGAIIIESSVHRRAAPESRIAVRVFGGLGAVKVDPGAGQLSIAIAIDHIELLEAGVMESILGAGGKKFFASQARELLEEAIPDLQVPVVLGREIHIPALEEGGIRLDSLAVPLNLSVDRVIAAGGKLWVTLHAEVGKVSGAEEGLGVEVKKKPRPAGPASPSPAPPQNPAPEGTGSLKPPAPAPKNGKEGGA